MAEDWKEGDRIYVECVIEEVTPCGVGLKFKDRRGSVWLGPLAPYQLLHRAPSPSAADLAVIRASLNELCEWIVDLANSGDAGNWNGEKQPAVMNGRAALAVLDRMEGK